MTGESPRVVLGMPAYDRPDTLARTLESLLSQTYSSFALVVVDDAPSDASKAIVERYAAAWPSLSYEANPVRLGMIGNWRKVFARARERYPRARYFAWVSDHDLWHPRWLETMVGVLDADPAVVLAYPRNFRMRPDHAWATDKQFETAGVADRRERLRRSATSMLAGDMIYGVMRVHALERAGVFRHVIVPDRQVLLAMALMGQVRQVPEVLWYREFIRPFDMARQREVFFPHGAPLYAYLPWHLQHFATMVWDFAVRGRGHPEFGRWDGLSYAGLQLWCSVSRDLTRPKSETRTALERTAIGRWITARFPAPPAGAPAEEQDSEA